MFILKVCLLSTQETMKQATETSDRIIKYSTLVCKKEMDILMEKYKSSSNAILQSLKKYTYIVSPQRTMIN